MPSFKLQVCAFLSDDCKTLYVFDMTGLYDAVLNTGGYSAPNPEAMAFTTATITLKLAGSTNQETPIDVFSPPDFPSSTTTNAWPITAASLNLTVFPTGITRVTYQITNNGSGDAALSFKANVSVLSMCEFDCCLQKKKLAIAKDPASCGCADSKTMEMLYLESLFEAVEAAVCCGDVNAANELISTIRTKCSASACADC